MAVKGTANIAMRVAVVDDDAAIRLYFRDVLQAAEDFRFVGEFSSATDALIGIPNLQPDLVLMDIRMPGLNGIECTKRLKRALPCLKIVIATGRHDDNAVQCSLRAGADAYLVKPISPDQCLATLRYASVIRTKDRVNPKNPVPSTILPKTCLPISPRENEVLKNLADGLLYKEISDRLGISYAAVHKYQHSLFQKLQVSNRSEAIRFWLDHSR